MKKLYTTVRDYLKKADSLLLALSLIAAIFGVLLISSAVRSSGSPGSIYVQSAAIVLGIGAFVVFSLIDVDIIADRWLFLTFASLALIVSLRWLGTEVQGNRAWIRFAGIGIQPAEVVKPIFIITLSHLAVRFSEQHKLNHPLSVLAMAALFGVHFVLIVSVSSDLGSAMVYLFIFALVMFAAGLKWYWFAGAMVFLIVSLPYLWPLLTDYQQQRILAPYVPSIDPTGRGVRWHVNLSQQAIASGQLFGQGLYGGITTQAGRIPFQQSDFIFSVAGEELGLVGCVAVVVLLCAIIIRCVQVGLRSQNRLGALTCFGIASMLAFQTFENIGMCIGVAPVIGLTLPFFSYGGSSIVTTFAAMGIVSGVKMKPRLMMFGGW